MSIKDILESEKYLSKLSRNILMDKTKKIFLPLENEIKEVANYYIAIEDALKNNNPGEVLRCCRLSAEAICKHLYYIRLNVYPSKATLNDLIYNLIKLGEINNLIEAQFKNIQNLGNVGSHHDLNKKITMEYIEPCIKSVAYIIKWYFKKFNIYLDEEQYNKDLDEIEWIKANEINTIEAYQAYISSNNIERKYFEEALNKISELEIISAEDDEVWGECKKVNSSKVYKDYLLKYPGGKYVKEASKLFTICKQNEIYDKQKWDRAIEEDTLLGYEKYISGDSIKNYLDLAKAKINEILNKGLENIYNEALEKYKKAESDYDYKEIVDLIEEASNKGHIKSNGLLGVLYCEGKGVKKDYSKAKELLEVAAENGDVLAQRYLGDLYFSGKGVEKSYEEAFKLYNESVSNGDIESSFMVGYSYLNGLGVKKDINKAISFLEIAACNNKVKAQVILGQIYYKGIQRDQDYKLAFEWYSKAAKNSSLEGIYMLGVMYYYGKGVVKNINESIRLLSIANKYRYFNDEYILEKAKAERGEMLFEKNKVKGKDELKLIADSFYYGNKESRCYKTAFKFYKLSAEKGNMKAMSSLAHMYLNGIGTSKNTKLAYEWYIKLAELGDSEGQVILGNAYKNGIYINGDNSKAAIWYIRASNQGNIEAMIELSFLYKYGTGVERDLNIAYELLNRARKLGSGEASIHLNRLKNIKKL